MSVPGENTSITLKNLTPEQPIKDAEQLAMSGHGYSSCHEAMEAGQKYQSALMVALARVRVGADFGQRAARGVYTEHGLKWLEQQVGHRVLNSAHGLMVFATDPKPRFAAASAKMVRGTNANLSNLAFRSHCKTPRPFRQGATGLFTLQRLVLPTKR